LPSDRQPDEEPAARTDRGFDPRLATVVRDDPRDDREADAIAVDGAGRK